MGLMDKVKKILFDEDEVEIPVNSDELPERAPKMGKEHEATTQRGFIDYHRDEDIEEDTIKEIKVPKDNYDDEGETEESNTFNFPVDIDFEEELPSRSRDNIDFAETTQEIPTYESRRDYYFEETPKRRDVEEKDYRKIINSTPEPKEKKPFKVTPIISPVYGILDKNYKPEEVVNKSEVINRKETNKPRLFGPVSYNDQPLPEPHKYEREEVKEENSLKEELVELNTTISELINDTINPGDVLPATKKIEVEEVVEEEIYEEEVYEEEYDEIETSGIENEYIGNNSIEDAFESTSEFDSITEADNESVEDITPSVDINELISDEEENLEDTIETDLFNLIDSMYKSDDSLEDEED